MAAALASRVPRYVFISYGRSLLGGLSNAFSGLMNSSSGMMNGNILSQQQQRTFIQMGTILKAVDNSGAKEVMCIQSLKGKKGARLGDIIVGSVKEAIPKGKVKKGKVVYSVVVRAAIQKGRVDGSQVRFDDNAVVIVGIKEKNKKNSDGSKKKMEYNQLVPECLVLPRMRCGTENSSRSLLWLSTSFESIHQTKTPVMISLCDPDPSITQVSA